MLERRGFVQALLAAPAAFAAVMTKPTVSRTVTAGLLRRDEYPGIRQETVQYFTDRATETVLFDNTGGTGVSR